MVLNDYIAIDNNTNHWEAHAHALGRRVTLDDIY